MAPVAVVAVSPVTPMSVMGMMSVSGPMLSVGTPLVFGPEDVVRPVSLRMSVMMGPTALAFVNIGVIHLFVDLVVMRALGMNHVVGIISNDKDHLQHDIKWGAAMIFEQSNAHGFFLVWLLY